jgi:DNA-binding XRE family transcriptional regulator
MAETGYDKRKLGGTTSCLKNFGGRPDDEITIPHAVIATFDERGVSLVRAWRDHLGLTQDEVAHRMGVTRQAYLQMESLAAHPRVATLKKIAAAMGIAWEQLRA